MCKQCYPAHPTMLWVSLLGLYWDHAKYHHIYCPCPLHGGSLRLQTWIIVKFCRSHAKPKPVFTWELIVWHYFTCATIVHSNAPTQIHVVALMELLHVKCSPFDQHDTLHNAWKYVHSSRYNTFVHLCKSQQCIVKRWVCLWPMRSRNSFKTISAYFCIINVLTSYTTSPKSFIKFPIRITLCNF